MRSSSRVFPILDEIKSYLTELVLLLLSLLFLKPQPILESLEPSCDWSDLSLLSWL